MLVPARKVAAFLEKHARRITDPIREIEIEEVSSLCREARLLQFGANADEATDLRWFLASCEALLGNLEKSLELFQVASTANPTNAALLVDLGATLGRLGRTVEALECFRRAERVSGDDPVNRAVACLNQAVALRDLGAHADADTVLKTMLVAPPPADYAALVQFAKASVMLDRDGDAVEFLARALCARVGRPRGDAPALELIDLLAPGLEEHPGTPTALAAAVREVRAREHADPPPEAVLSARVVLPPDAWDTFVRLLPA